MRTCATEFFKKQPAFLLTPWTRQHK